MVKELVETRIKANNALIRLYEINGISEVLETIQIFFENHSDLSELELHNKITTLWNEIHK